MIKKTVTISLLILSLLLVFVGYLKSDSLFFAKLIKLNNITTPREVFHWATKNYDRATSGPAHHYLSPRYLIEKHKFLWCDEGAIIMATLDHKLGYKTRLIDLYGNDNISHHTIMEVFEHNKWVTYDFTFKLRDKPASAGSDSCHFRLKEARIKPYPKFYNFVVNNNFFAKKLIFMLRGIREVDPVQ
ncbi:MAG: hypothetical protein M3N14_02255 [Bacteroidota bacterium]|nr:hypothetical protein [Bacteroidota bacterium]